MVAGRYSGRLAVSVGIAGAVVFLAAPVAAQPAPSPVVASPVKPSPSATPSPVPSAALVPQPAVPSHFPNVIGQPAQVPQPGVEPAQGQPDQAEPEPDAVEPTPDVRVYGAQPEPLPEPTAAPDGVPVSGTQRDARLPDPKLLIVAGATGLAFSTVGVAVVWYRRRSF